MLGPVEPSSVRGIVLTHALARVFHARVSRRRGECGDAAVAEAPPAEQAQLDFRLIEPTPVLGGEMHGEPPQEQAARARPELVGQRLLSMATEVVEDVPTISVARVTIVLTSIP